MGGDAGCALIDEGKIRPPTGARRSPDRQKHDIGAWNRRTDIGGELKPAFTRLLNDHLPQAGLEYGHASRVQSFDLACIGIDTNHLVSETRKTSAAYEPNVARSDNSNLHGHLPNACDGDPVRHRTNCLYIDRFLRREPNASICPAADITTFDCGHRLEMQSPARGGRCGLGGVDSRLGVGLVRTTTMRGMFRMLRIAVDELVEPAHRPVAGFVLTEEGKVG